MSTTSAGGACRDRATAATARRPSTPRVIENRPGLGRDRLPRPGRTATSWPRCSQVCRARTVPAWPDCGPATPTTRPIALLDAWAVVCDVLTFYSERLANESYLRTATERTSLQELGKLLAYRLDPGAAAETLPGVRPRAAAGLPTPRSTGSGIGSSGRSRHLMLPVGLRVQSIPGPGETAADVRDGRGDRGTTRVERAAGRSHRAPSAGQRTGRTPGFGGLNLAWGGAILLLASADLINDKWDVRLLTECHRGLGSPAHACDVGSGLGSYTPFNDPAISPTAYVLRKRVSVFGHNAPVWSAMNAEFSPATSSSSLRPRPTPAIGRASSR